MVTSERACINILLAFLNIVLAELVGAIIVMLILAMLYEGLKTLRDVLGTLEKKMNKSGGDDEKKMTKSGGDDEMKQLLPGAQ